MSRKWIHGEVRVGGHPWIRGCTAQAYICTRALSPYYDLHPRVQADSYGAVWLRRRKGYVPCQEHQCTLRVCVLGDLRVLGYYILMAAGRFVSLSCPLPSFFPSAKSACADSSGPMRDTIRARQGPPSCPQLGETRLEHPNTSPHHTTLTQQF